MGLLVQYSINRPDPRSVNDRNLLKTLERETGIEPATSSLGNCISIVYTEFSVYGVYFRLYRTCSFTESAKIHFLMEPKWSHSGESAKDELLGLFFG